MSWRNFDNLTEATLDVSLELEARRRAAASATAESSELLLLVVDIFPTSSRSRSSSLIKNKEELLVSAIYSYVSKIIVKQCLTVYAA